MEAFSNRKNSKKIKHKPYPITISVVGPRKTGKTMMLKSLLSFFRNVDQISYKSPVTVFTKEEAPIVLMEGNSDILSAINLSKTSDIVILMIDGFFGLELETFEFITLSKINGVKKIYCVITHLDLFKKWKGLKRAKKRIKDRITKEFGNQTKFFFFSGITTTCLYFSTEISNMTRFFSSPLSLKKDHSPHIIVSRINFFKRKNHTDTICFGFLRGSTPEKLTNYFCDIPGFGPIKIKNWKKIPNFRKSKIKWDNRHSFQNKKTRVFDYENSKPKKISFKTYHSVRYKKFFLFLVNLAFLDNKKKLDQNCFYLIVDSHKFGNYPVKKKQNYCKIKDSNWFKGKKNTKRIGFLKKNISFGKKGMEILPATKCSVFLEYCMITVDISSERFKKYFDPLFPLILSFLPNFIQKKRLVNTKVTRHKWNKKIPKSGEFYCVSLGWQFFKTKVFFCKKHPRQERITVKKNLNIFSPSLASFYAFSELKKSTIIGFFLNHFDKKNGQNGTFFLISFTGFLLETQKEWKIFKKLKLKGKVYKNFKKTVLVRSMFSSEMEVTRFQGALLEDKNGNRGIIKKPILDGPRGSFRAAFEKKVQNKGDVFLRIWVSIKLERFYQPNEMLLVPNDFREIWGSCVFPKFKFF